MKGDLPLVLVEDTIWYEDWNHIFQTGADAYIKDLLQFDIGVIIFKNLYKVFIFVNCIWIIFLTLTLIQLFFICSPLIPPDDFYLL